MCEQSTNRKYNYPKYYAKSWNLDCKLKVCIASMYDYHILVTRVKDH